ncbi:MMPL family transporter [Shouchella hunanensis]|uniref:MMPL family transporter n=1 Tax=Shouchella hunanensis TaxID=766894 RepID=A0ABY7W795_9BACI|nr:MMPL family transporter [Shouchella hunanensis]WDF04817.1 MMPL family transporter [Shouchella hunanensis]
MKKLLYPITDWVSTKKGMWITIIAWLLLMIILTFGPPVSDSTVTNFQSLPNEAESIIADSKIEELFPNQQGTPGILVFHNNSSELDTSQIGEFIQQLDDKNMDGVKTVLPFHLLPEEALTEFTSVDGSTIIVPYELETSLGAREYNDINTQIEEYGTTLLAGETELFITGPVGIAGDTLELFEQADFVLLLATVVIILLLLIIIYRSPLLAIIPLFATIIVYQIVNQLLGLLGANGLEINNSTTSIMSILLFAAVIDYSLFVFSRYREELFVRESKYSAMKSAMRATGEPVFIAALTVLAAVSILFFADFRDYQNFAPVFGVALAVISIASITLVPALFTLFGRKAFWPKIPKYLQGQSEKPQNGFWNRFAKLVVRRPGLFGGLVGIILIVTASNVTIIDFEFNSVKNFPEDLGSRVGYDIVEENFDKGQLAPTTILLESENALDPTQLANLVDQYTAYDEISEINQTNTNEENSAMTLSMSLALNPYSTEAMDFIETFREDFSNSLSDEAIEANVYVTGTTAKLVDERSVNNQDIVLIVVLETILILALLVVLTRSLKMASYMIATILLSYLSAMGLGIFLVDTLFGFDAVSTRVPVYAFIFSVALGIDYNIMLASRFIEERKQHHVKKALEIAIANTGAVISSAGLILAATFAALTTMPVADLFVFGFIVSIGILIDTFLVRGMLLPAFILFFEKDKQKNHEKVKEGL